MNNRRGFLRQWSPVVFGDTFGDTFPRGFGEHHPITHGRNGIYATKYVSALSCAGRPTSTTLGWGFKSLRAHQIVRSFHSLWLIARTAKDFSWNRPRHSSLRDDGDSVDQHKLHALR